MANSYTRRLEGANLSRRAIHGLVWLFAQNIVARATSLLSQLALAALLQPADFGMIGLASSVTNIAQAITNVGVEDVLLQRKDKLSLWSGPAFWIMLLLFVVSGAVVAAAAPVAAAAFKAPGLVGLLLISGASMPISAFAIVPGAALRARLRFEFLASWGAFEAITQASLTILFAWLGFKAYSFVVPVPIVSALRAVVWSAAAHSSMPLNFTIKFKRWKFLIGNSAITFATRMISAVISQGDYLVLGLLAGESAVGRYYFGFRLAAQPLWMLAGNLSGVVLPALVQLKNDPKRQGEAALKASILVSYTIMPLAFIQAAVAGPLIKRFFAHHWDGSIPIIQLLSIGLAFDAVSWIAGSLLTSRGEFRARLNNQMTQLPVFFTLVTMGTLLGGSIGTAAGVFLHYVLTQPPFVYGVYRRLGLTVSNVASIYIKPTVLASVATGSGILVSRLLPVSAPISRVLVVGLASSMLYAALVRWRMPSVWDEFASRIRSAIWRP